MKIFVSPVRYRPKQCHCSQDFSLSKRPNKSRSTKRLCCLLGIISSKTGCAGALSRQFPNHCLSILDVFAFSLFHGQNNKSGS